MGAPKPPKQNPPPPPVTSTGADQAAQKKDAMRREKQRCSFANTLIAGNSTPPAGTKSTLG